MKPRRPTWEWVALAAIAVAIGGWACWFNARQNARDVERWEQMQAWQRQIQRGR